MNAIEKMKLIVQLAETGDKFKISVGGIALCIYNIVNGRLYCKLEGTHSNLSEFAISELMRDDIEIILLPKKCEVEPSIGLSNLNAKLTKLSQELYNLKVAKKEFKLKFEFYMIDRDSYNYSNASIDAKINGVYIKMGLLNELIAELK